MILLNFNGFFQYYNAIALLKNFLLLKPNLIGRGEEPHFTNYFFLHFPRSTKIQNFTLHQAILSFR